MIFVANIPIGTKLIYMLMLTPVFITNKGHKILTFKNMCLIMFISTVLYLIEPLYRIQTIIAMSVLGLIATLSYYIPAQYLIMICTISLASLYACILTVYIATATDVYMLSFFGGFISILWLFFANLRPPFEAIR
jgi:hypothetical protein